MLWAAGQERETREQRARLTDLFTAARDAELDVGVSTGQLKAQGTWHLPSYIDTSPAQRRATARRGLAQLIADFPANVAPGKEFLSDA